MSITPSFSLPYTSKISPNLKALTRNILNLRRNKKAVAIVCTRMESPIIKNQPPEPIKHKHMMRTLISTIRWLLPWIKCLLLQTVCLQLTLIDTASRKGIHKAGANMKQVLWTNSNLTYNTQTRFPSWTLYFQGQRRLTPKRVNTQVSTNEKSIIRR